MFMGFQFRRAVLDALLPLVHSGAITRQLRKAMSGTACNRINSRSGKRLMKTGVAGNSHAAAAHVFARLAIAAERTQWGEAEFEDWADAVRVALVNSGTGEAESFSASSRLIQFHRLSDSATDLAHLGT